jgi:hypothetical protein
LVYISYLKKNTSSTLLVLSAAIALLVISGSVLPLSNPLLLQPVQASSIGSSSSSPGDISFRTPTPAIGNMFGTPDNDVKLTFDAQGTNLVSPQRLDTKGAYLITSREEGTLYNGSVVYVQGCCLTNNSMGESIHLFSHLPSSITGISLITSCSTSATNHIGVYNGSDYIGAFQGPVECSPQGGDSTTQQSSSSTGTTTTTQDRDSDGIPDANDNCPNLPNTRCYNEGDTALVVHDRNR